MAFNKFYNFAIAGDSIDLIEVVNSMIDDGFEPFGSPIFDPANSLWKQAMLKDKGKLSASDAYQVWFEDNIQPELDLEDEED